MSSKRARTPSTSSVSSPVPKAYRSSGVPSSGAPSGETPNCPLLCTLRPTCHPPENRPTPLKDTAELEAHYAKFHAHVCEVRGCGCVFPEARMLQLVSHFYI